jgi:hypothetical protein
LRIRTTRRSGGGDQQTKVRWWGGRSTRRRLHGQWEQDQIGKPGGDVARLRLFFISSKCGRRQSAGSFVAVYCCDGRIPTTEAAGAGRWRVSTGHSQKNTFIAVRSALGRKTITAPSPPIGKQITLDFVPDERPREVVGVVDDTTTALDPVHHPMMYIPHLQQTSQSCSEFSRALPS